MDLELCGSISVRALIIDGPERLRIDPNDEVDIKIQVVMCLSHLAALEPRARLQFDFGLETVTVAPEPMKIVDAGETDLLEMAWLPKALNALGYASFEAFLSRNQSSETGSAFGVIITRHLKPHYAYTADRKITLSPTCGGRGVRYLHALLLHEICHVFGAVDEYPDCHCLERQDNDNCYVCNPAPQPCIMAGNSLAICPATRRQIGWSTIAFPSVSTN